MEIEVNKRGSQDNIASNGLFVAINTDPVKLFSITDINSEGLCFTSTGSMKGLKKKKYLDIIVANDGFSIEKVKFKFVQSDGRISSSLNDEDTNSEKQVVLFRNLSEEQQYWLNYIIKNVA